MIKLSKAGKMPCRSWSLQALETCKGAYDMNGEIVEACSGCYALKGNYRFSNVMKSRAHNLQDCKREEWVDDMVVELDNDRYFRWFDSGDLQGIKMLEDINNIAWASPHVKFWLPTKEYTLIKDHSLDIAPNLIIRVSNPNKNKSFKDSFDYVSAVFDKDILPKDSHICPSSKQGNKCGSCRACWSDKVKEVIYLAH